MLFFAMGAVVGALLGWTRKPSIEGVHARARPGDQPHAPVVELLHGDKVVGHLQASTLQWSEWDPDEGCAGYVADLVERLDLGDAKVYVAWRTGILEPYRERGYGVLLYEVMLEELERLSGAPVVLVPEGCLEGGKTSPSAGRVWESLHRRYEGEGSVVASVRLGASG